MCQLFECIPEIARGVIFGVSFFVFLFILVAKLGENAFLREVPKICTKKMVFGDDSELAQKMSFIVLQKETQNFKQFPILGNFNLRGGGCFWDLPQHANLSLFFVYYCLLWSSFVFLLKIGKPPTWKPLNLQQVWLFS